MILNPQALLEYDDVLNLQRSSIYAQRNRVLARSDLKDDVAEMLRAEIIQRVTQEPDGDNGPLSLLAWLEQIQPPLTVSGLILPSFPLRLLIEFIKNQLPENADRQALRQDLLTVARLALEAEQAHQLDNIAALLEQAEDRLETQIEERLETVDAFFDEISESLDGQTPAAWLSELGEILRLPLKLTAEIQRSFVESRTS